MEAERRIDDYVTGFQDEAVDKEQRKPLKPERTKKKRSLKP